MEYELVVGLETHVQLKTRTKLFCGCEVRFQSQPNSLVCPVCMGLPGSLPVLNQESLNLAVKTALALGCKVSNYMKFDRKNYFYPDLPKNYQISQYDMPLAANGYIDVNGKKIRIQRVHMEEDAGKLMHEREGERSFVDLNRAGVPLVEIVTMPDMNSTEEVQEYLRELKSIIQYCDISDCDMEKGELRCDVNLSIRPKGSSQCGARTEIKNLNSFRFAIEAVNYEFERHVKAVKQGERIVMETRLYDPDRKVTVPMRSKEEVHDYRYFPEPDLKPFVLTEDFISRLRNELPELPRAKKSRFISTYNLSEYDAEVLVSDKRVGDFFEAGVKISNKPKSVANWVMNDIIRIMKESGIHVSDSKLKPDMLSDLIDLVESSKITLTAGKDILKELYTRGGSPSAIVAEKGLEKVTDTGFIQNAVKDVIAKFPNAVEDFKSGKETALKYLIGQVMRETKGKASPQVITELLQKFLKN